jgi:hypothetical protein
VGKEYTSIIPLDDNMVNVQLMRPFTAFMHVCIERIDKLDFSHFEANAGKHMSHIVQSQDAPAHNETV